MLLRRLAISNFFVRRVRVALTVTAIALAVSLVVSVTSGYASVEAAARKFLNQYLGAWDAEIRRSTDYGVGIPVSLADELHGDRDVRRVAMRVESDVLLLDKDGKPIEGRHASGIGIDRGVDDSTDKLRLTAGRWFEPDEPDAVVIDESTQQYTKLNVGDTMYLPDPKGKWPVKVVGIVHKPALFLGYINTMYVPLATLQKFSFEGKTDRVSKLQIEFNEEVDSAAFVSRWSDRLKQLDPLLALQLTRERREDLDQNLQALHILSYFGGMVSMLAATFIVFSTVSMGVSERQRSLAMLRAVGLLRSQLVKLVLMEGLLLAALGALIGVPLGMLWIKLIAMKYSLFFTSGAVTSWGGVLFATLGSVFAAIVASIIPAYCAARVDPLEAMSPLANTGIGQSRPPVIATLLGLLLVAIDPLLMFVNLGGAEQSLSIQRDIKFYAHFVIGMPTLMIGFFLLAPLFVWTVDRAGSRIIAALLGVQHTLLRQQLSGGLWRAAGTCAALMVGLSVLVVMQTQGHTALKSWQLPDRFPDVFIWTKSRAGLDRTAQERIAHAEGVKPDGTMPIAMFSPEFGGSIFAVAGAAMIPTATMYFGVDPNKAFEMMHLDFRQGDKDSAAEMLKKGKHLVITEEFHKLKGLNVGDTFTLVSRTKGKIDFTVAGVVWSPGIDVMVSTFDLGRQFEQRTAASVFGSLDDARELFGVESVYVIATNLELSVPKEELIKRLQTDLGDMGLNVADVRQLKHDIETTFARLLLIASTVAWAALAVASLGVTNTIMASVRSRRWQFGILRSIGVTRDVLLRLVLAEALLIGLVSVALGLCAGGLMALDAHKFYASLFGYDPPFAVPWPIVLIGAGVVMLISILASLFPALHVAREDPLSLLQAGRAAA